MCTPTTDFSFTPLLVQSRCLVYNVGNCWPLTAYSAAPWWLIQPLTVHLVFRLADFQVPGAVLCMKWLIQLGLIQHYHDLSAGALSRYV